MSESVNQIIEMKGKTIEETESANDETYTITNTINRQINNFMIPPCDLLEWKDMPTHLQFNPYVHTGNLPIRIA